MKHKNYTNWVPFIDMILNVLMGFVFLFLVSFLLINPSKQNKNTEAKGEFLITVSWADKSEDDVDTWVEDPQGRVVWFNHKEDGFMHLDRDDLGLLTDQIVGPGGVVTQVYLNREVVTIRGVLAGEYTVNVHMYGKKDPTPTEITVDVVKLNPYSIVGNQKVILERKWQEATAIRFTINADGTVKETNTLQKNLAKTPTMSGIIQ